MNVPALLQEPPDFSLVLGGPVYQLFNRAHLGEPVLEQLRLRVVVIVSFVWLPLLLLSVVSGHLLGGQGLPFLLDIETQIRLLIVLPVLIIAELVVHQRIRAIVKRFAERRIVTAEDTPKFHAAIESAIRVRNSIPLELALLVFAFTVGHWVWAKEVALGAASWYGVPDAASNFHLTLPGYWYGFVGIPLTQFFLFRWYMRLLVWSWLLWRVSRLNLRLLPAHPDRAGGIGFLGKSTFAFAPILFAEGALLSGVIASRILHEGQSLLTFKVSIVVLVIFFVVVILGPMLVFTPLLAAAKRRGLSEYGTLATAYVEEFDEKWLRGGANGEAILGSADVQSLADLGNSFSVVREMRAIPFVLDDVTVLVGATVLPLLPLLLTVMPLEELVSRLVKIIF
jgi:hypothetical protein